MVACCCVEKNPLFGGGLKKVSVVSKFEQSTTHELDFDRWAKLAETDPDAFEAARSAAIEDLLESFPVESRERMRRLQWRIDQERRLAKSPMGACIRLSKMMWRQMLGEGGLRERLLELGGALGGEKAPVPAPQARASEGAQVLAFSRTAD